jgi:hypothetical protein
LEKLSSFVIINGQTDGFNKEYAEPIQRLFGRTQGLMDSEAGSEEV